jgi:hypothetical protein
MADFRVGDVVRDYLTVVDEDMVEQTGLNFTVEEALDPDGLTYAVNAVEIGGGTYRISFTATKSGTYYWRVQTVGLSVEQAFENTFVIDPFSIFGAAISTSSYGVPLNDLVRMVAVEIADFREVEATIDGSADGSNFVDTLRLAAIQPAELKGASITVVYPEDSANAFIERRIVDASEDSTQVTVTPSFPSQVIAGQKAWIHNLHSRGHWRSQYIGSINNTILGAYPMHLIPLEYTYPDVFDEADPVIPLPAYMTHVYGVEATTATGQFLTVNASTHNILYGEGWAADSTTASLIFGGSYPSYIHGGSVRLLGYGRPATLVDHDDFTTVDAAWIVSRAAASLRWSSGDQRLFPVASNFQNIADTDLLKILTPLQPGTIRVR